MMLIDLTTELTPMINGLNVLLVAAALALFAEPASRALRTWFRGLSGPRVIARPAMGHSR